MIVAIPRSVLQKVEELRNESCPDCYGGVVVVVDAVDEHGQVHARGAAVAHSSASCPAVAGQHLEAFFVVEVPA